MGKDQNPWLPPGAEWIEWHGGDNPVPGAVVDYLLCEERMNREHATTQHKSHLLSWEHEGCFSDIVAYRVVTPAPTSTSRDELFSELVRTLTDVRVGGLTYWEPQTKLDYQNKSAMIARVDAVLSKARAA